MSKNIDRLRFYNTLAMPREGTEARKKVEADIEAKLARDPKFKKRVENLIRGAGAKNSVQSKNGAGLLCDKQLRVFLNEFNGRQMKYGIGAMPAAFNVMEGFFEHDQKLNSFVLFPEIDHYFSF